ncbi:serine hydrolase [Streptomyces lunaelactis]|uniref:serine hydrolase n=1 Tax=Streptomyces lunaelactis TaxID=1535768 RepID=UPI0015853E0F|nr:serine hydrolase [Streptomyces lunaelactis]NUK02555.1 serine hydrolase [Streptomyces lunaelactis]NUK16518.1 serine hydrolase [Streptomyces lunaelactis]NUK73316.1 serine hydrolase [Streptomyces lunaelactis]NUK81681.1 serine hydrolase [Streptomyces lunaelactis]
MTHHRIRGRAARRARGAAAVLAAATLVPLAAATAPAAAATPQVACTSQKAGLAAKLTADITAALAGRRSTTAVLLNDRVSKTSCVLRPDQKYDSASVVKVTVLAALLQEAQIQKRGFTQREFTLASDMITKSDNAATSALWKQLGTTKIKRFLTAAGMTQTVPGANGYWGLTQINARDEQKQLAALTVKNTVLSDASRSYALKLMSKVITSQRWGTPAGAPATATVQVKNGWLSRATHGWRVHSIGAFTGNGHDYTITVLTQDNATMNDGVNTIQAVARAIHKDLNPAASARTAFVPPAAPQEAVPASPQSPAVPLITAVPSPRT